MSRWETPGVVVVRSGAEASAAAEAARRAAACARRRAAARQRELLERARTKAREAAYAAVPGRTATVRCKPRLSGLPGLP